MTNETLNIDETWFQAFVTGKIGINGDPDGCHKDLMQQIARLVNRYSSNPEFRAGVLEQLAYAARAEQEYQARMNASFMAHLSSVEGQRRNVEV